MATGSWCCTEHNCELGFEPLWLWPRRRHGRRRGAFGCGRNGDYRGQTSTGARGRGRGAHSGVGEGVSKLGEVLAAANRPEMARVPEVEDEGEDGVWRRLESHGSVERSRVTRRSY